MKGIYQNKGFSLMMMAAAMLSLDTPNSNTKNKKTSIDDIDFTPKKSPLPKGCKEYSFNQDGNFTTIESEIIFKCVAISEKSAIKKYNRFSIKHKKPLT
jgi:hypothetical protein